MISPWLGPNYYAEPGGNPLAKGSPTEPTSLQAALDRVQAGGTVYLNSGQYDGDFISNNDGTLANPIYIKPVSRAARIVINQSITLNGDYNYLGEAYCIHCKDPDWTDRAVTNGKVGIDVPAGTGSKVINCISTDNAQGGTSGASSVNVQFTGNIFRNCGIANSQLGHSVYPQNAAGNPETYLDNVFVTPYGFNFHGYGSDDMDDFILRGNTAIDAGAHPSADGRYRTNYLIGGGAAVVNPELDENWSYFSGNKETGIGVQLGDGDNAVTGAILTDNISVGGENVSEIHTHAIKLLLCVPGAMTGNTLRGQRDPTTLPTDFPSNTYGDDPAAIGNSYRLRVNPEDNVFAKLDILNQAENATVTVSLSGYASAGQSIKIHNIQGDWDTDTKTVVVDGSGNLAVDMRASEWTVETPHGTGQTAAPSTLPRAGFFILEKI